MKTLSDAIQQIKTHMMTYFDTKVDPILWIVLRALYLHWENIISQLEHRVGANDNNLNDLSTRVKQLEKDNCRRLRHTWVCGPFDSTDSGATSPLRRLLRGLIALQLSDGMTDPAQTETSGT